ncbi:Arm DNA-binding domain-containing protein [Deltaproteobacteria bacterium]|nr:Arm DNA-binding domain-containing protein [Deltaproteobacteria bacterium]
MNKLTENSIRKAQILEKQYKIYDGDGMFLLIHQNGSKYWRMKYTFDGKSKLASFGVWPGVSLKEARKRRHEAKQKIKMGINPIEEKRKNKQLHQKQSTNNVNNESVQAKVSTTVSNQRFRMLSPQEKGRVTEASLQLLKSNIFDNSGKKPFSLLSKQELNEILGNIYRNRRDLFQIIWDFYLSFPILNIAVLFLLLLIVMDFSTALFTTMLYFILTVCTAVVFGLWEEKKVQE